MMPADDQKRAAQVQENQLPRVRGGVRTALVQAGLELARSGGPDAVVLREVTRRVGVVPNAAYRHFADRDALLAAVRDEAFKILANRMGSRMSRVRAGPHTPTGARLRLHAVGASYLDFARNEPGLFDTAYAATDHPPSQGADDTGPFQQLQSALDNLVQAGILEPSRRPNIEYPTWATVHGIAVLLRGPLSPLPEREKTRLETETLAFIGAAVC
jgi:AcrR family transcriptional regulator